MCGICGIYNVHTKEPVPISLVKNMADTIKHRGPDDEGFYVDKQIGLGHRRLSIIDLEGGHQPLTNEDQTVWVVFNGEIYNFQALRADLLKRGHIFTTNSDTEVIVHLYEEVGEACFQALRGMFALAIWDKRKEILILARDRIGKKPLFYCYDGRRVVFASEMKAIRQVPGVSQEIDLEALCDYFSLLYIPAPKSIYKSIRKVRPGHFVTIGAHGMREVEYWDLDVTSPQEKFDEEWCQLILDAYREAVKVRLISDVPLGAFLSGGVDSSSVVALMSEVTGRPVVTTSIGFAEKEFDELAYARQIAKQFHSIHYEQSVRPDAVAVAEKLVWHYDEPFADSSAVPTYYVSQLARQHVTVALSGDGGDELFSGYRRYLFDERENRVRSLLPHWFRHAVFGSLAAVYPKADWAPRVLRGKATFQNLACSHVEGYFRSVSAFSPELKLALFDGDVRKSLHGYDTGSIFQAYYDKAKAADPLSRIHYIDVKTYLPDDILVKVDRASMAHSLEVRAPFLDHPFMELAARIPVHRKQHAGIGKFILKKALKHTLPDEILNRSKMGFGVPLAQWFRGDLKEMAQDVLFAPMSDGFLEDAVIRKMWSEHQKGFRNRSTELWTIFMFKLWHRRSGASC